MLDTVNMERSRAERLRIDRVSKSFFGVPVLREVSLTAGTGEIIGLLGANGAGKSTLMKILSGVYSSEGGEISVDGHRVKIETPQDAIAAGIRLMPQELSVHPDLTVAENICIADLPRRRFLGMPWIDRGDMERTAADYLDRLGLGHIDPHTRMGSLSLPQQRIVEIARALVGDARVLIMDEPTATLAEAEVRTLFEVIERLRLQGVTIIYISHYLDEVFRLCDRIVVLRDGDVRGNFSTAETDQDTVLTAMLGSELGQLYPEKAGDLSHNEPILSVEGMSLPGAFQDVSFQVRRGEVFGVFGLVGSGAEQIGRALYGGRSQVQVRQAKFKGAPFSPTSPRDSVRDGLAFVAAERKSEGLVGILSVRENTTLPFLKKFTRHGVVDREREGAATQHWIETLGVRTTGPEQEIRLLSGGNQQKVCLARWLEGSPDFLILEEPTRGVDLGARREIYDEIRTLAEQGLGILLVSSDAEEIAGLADRTMVMADGRKLGDFGPEADAADLLRAASPETQYPGESQMSETETTPAASQADKQQQSRKRGGALATFLARPTAGLFMLLVFYVVLLAVFSVLSPYFLTTGNLSTIGTNMAFIGLMAAAGTPLIIGGGLDLSVAAVAGLSGVIVALMHAAGINIWAGCFVALLAGGSVGLLNGLIATGLRLNPLIVTLGTMSIFTGLSMVLTGGLSKPLFLPAFNWLGSGRLFGLPVPVLLMVTVFVAFWLLLSRTPFGRFVYATGGNADASTLLGVPVQRTQIILYVLSGLSGALAGIVLAAMLGAAAPNAAGPHLLTIIAAIILGGTSLFGGRGSVWGTLIAVLILGTLNNGLTLLNVSSFWQDVTRGVVLLLAVGLDQLRVRLQG
ncbi:ATP-binding cassette domain-containing protein [Roseibium sp. Sym1]|uniref:ATP-binding cassette domain-containing protein n=1 Tax=Roseibium sp. Sym1 TaxID=3016006 RepID=UPI0022B5052D|nr:ATP-binding cassette domain-containing protein [Roseibium sp. Sym1]